MTTRIAVINHKGGVGKTTLVWHLAQLLSMQRYRVVCVDADPQCNLTQLFLGEAGLDRLLDKSDARTGQTLWSVATKGARARVHHSKSAASGLVAGDVQMHKYEALLATAWSIQGAMPNTESIHQLTLLGRILEGLEKDTDPDFVLFDTAPSLGPLNRNIVLESDFIVVPLSTDLFSVRGLRSLGVTLVDWMREWERLSRFAPTEWMTREGKPILGGYILQQTDSHSSSAIARVQGRVTTDLLRPMSRVDRRLARGREVATRLGIVPKYPFMSKTQDESIFAWDFDKSARHVFEEIAERLVQRVRSMRGRVG